MPLQQEPQHSPEPCRFALDPDLALADPALATWPGYTDGAIINSWEHVLVTSAVLGELAQHLADQAGMTAVELADAYDLKVLDPYWQPQAVAGQLADGTALYSLEGLTTRVLPAQPLCTTCGICPATSSRGLCDQCLARARRNFVGA